MRVKRLDFVMGAGPLALEELRVIVRGCDDGAVDGDVGGYSVAGGRVDVKWEEGGSVVDGLVVMTDKGLGSWYLLATVGPVSCLAGRRKSDDGWDSRPTFARDPDQGVVVGKRHGCSF